MRVVSSNSDQDIARNEALARVDRALCELTSNLLRVARGAGKPSEIVHQTVAFMEACTEHRQAAGFFPVGQDLSEMLSIAPEGPRQELPASERARESAEERVIRGALQIVASRPLGQRTQESVGDGELHGGVRELEAWHAEQRRQWLAETRPKRAPAKKRKALPKRP